MLTVTRNWTLLPHRSPEDFAVAVTRWTQACLTGGECTSISVFQLADGSHASREVWTSALARDRRTDQSDVRLAFGALRRQADSDEPVVREFPDPAQPGGRVRHRARQPHEEIELATSTLDQAVHNAESGEPVDVSSVESAVVEAANAFTALNAWESFAAFVEPYANGSLAALVPLKGIVGSQYFNRGDLGAAEAWDRAEMEAAPVDEGDRRRAQATFSLATTLAATNRWEETTALLVGEIPTMTTSDTYTACRLLANRGAPATLPAALRCAFPVEPSRGYHVARCLRAAEFDSVTVERSYLEWLSKLTAAEPQMLVDASDWFAHTGNFDLADALASAAGVCDGADERTSEFARVAELASFRLTALGTDLAAGSLRTQL